MIELRIRLTPNSSRDDFRRDEHYGIVCYVRAQAIDGKANKALIELCAERLKLPKSAVVIKSGFTTRIKTVVIATTIPLEQVINMLCGNEEA